MGRYSDLHVAAVAVEEGAVMAGVEADAEEEEAFCHTPLLPLATALLLLLLSDMAVNRAATLSLVSSR